MKPMVNNLENLYYTDYRDTIQDKFKRLKNYKEKEIIN